MEKTLSFASAKAMLFPFLLVLVLWIIHGSMAVYHISGLKLGVFPRHTFGLPGVLTSVFIHDDWNHLINNTIPLLVLGWALFEFYRSMAWWVFAYIWLVSGSWLWLIGRESYHIGASGIVYGLATFLILSGILRREIRVSGISFLVIFLYGSMFWGLFPMDIHVSFEAHICGALSGLLIAWFYRKSGIQATVFSWNEEEELSEDENAYWKVPDQFSNVSEFNPEKIHKKGEPENTDSPEQ